MKRSLSFALLAFHLLVFVLGAPLVLSAAGSTSRAAAAGHHVVVASGYGVGDVVNGARGPPSAAV